MPRRPSPSPELVAALRARKSQREARARVLTRLQSEQARDGLRTIAKALRRRPARARKLRPIPHPNAQAEAYKLALRVWVRSLAERTRTALQPLIERYGATDTVDSGDMAASVPRGHAPGACLAERADAVKGGGEVKSTVARLRAQFAKEAPGFARKTSKRSLTSLESSNRAATNAQFRELLGVDLFTGQSPAVAEILDAAVTENVRLITSIPERMLDQVESTVLDGIESGTRVENIMGDLTERFGVAESRAELIARDQIGKVNGQLVEARAGEIGIDDYTWVTSEDDRVRESHQELDGTSQKFSDPPVVDEATGRTANPGEDFQCRCNALPNVEGLLDSLGV